MAVNNRLAKTEEKKPEAVIEYNVNGEHIKLNVSMVRKYLVKGGGNITDTEAMSFIFVCRSMGLNPFSPGEVSCVKFGSEPATVIVGKDTFLKRAKKDPNFAGFQAGIIVEDNETGGLTEREGAFYNPAVENILGGWAKVFVKGYDVPFYTSVPFAEYVGKKKGGEVNSQWSTRPATMIRKVALAHALKEAFPEQNAGMNVQEEIPEVSDMVLDTNAVVVPEEEVTEEPKEERPADVAASIFG